GDVSAPVLAGGVPGPPVTTSSTGAGWSGSGAPAGQSSIQRSISPFEYVCSALNCNRTGSVGTGPIVSGSNGFSSGEAVGRDHVTLVTGDPMAPPSTVVVHPATVGRSTRVIGTPSGKKSCTCVVPASDCSFSTESCRVTTLPVPAWSGSNSLCAH